MEKENYIVFDAEEGRELVIKMAKEEADIIQRFLEILKNDNLFDESLNINLFIEKATDYKPILML